MPKPLQFGPVRGVAVGRRFKDREALKAAQVHGHSMAGIYGRKDEGAPSVVLAGGFEDEDHGDHFVYIGSGGREPSAQNHYPPQTRDQSFENRLNAALKLSAERRLPVRVTRGSRSGSKYAPNEGYRYDGLYVVSNPRIEVGSKGLKVCKFDFHRLPGQPPLPPPDAPAYYEQTDIEIRRQEYARYRETRAKGNSRASSTSGPEGHPADVDAASEYSEDDGTRDDPFDDIPDVEKELEPVMDSLDKLQAPETSGKDRARAMLQIGRHVLSVLETKKQQGTDEAGRDAAWWYDALWGYVGCAIPKKPDDEAHTAHRVEEMYNFSRERAEKTVRKKRQAEGSSSDEDVKIKAREAEGSTSEKEVQGEEREGENLPRGGGVEEKSLEEANPPGDEAKSRKREREDTSSDEEVQSKKVKEA